MKAFLHFNHSLSKVINKHQEKLPTMARIPVRFKRVAEAFDEVARARVCQSSGSEHSPESLTDLSDLVNSFLERDHNYRESGDIIKGVDYEKEGINKSDSEMRHCANSETKDLLRSLLGYGDDDEVKQNIHAEVEMACRVIGNSSSPGFKRRLMTRLRERGFDAGLCKSKWEKTGRSPPGNYEYIDVNVAGTRYIIEVFLAGEFKIARPTDFYASLLDILPPIFVGKVEELKKIARLMCNAIKKSLKSLEMHVPPWKRYVYMQAKWFSSYKRTINEVQDKKKSDSDEESARKRAVVGFVVPLPVISTYYCREDFVSKVDLRVGNLAMAINGSSMLL